MKIKLFFTFLTFLLLTLWLPNTYAQDYTQLNLPEGAKTRLGKGVINDMQLSPDGNRLAIASSIGVWLYDVNTGEETALLSGHTDYVKHVAFSPDGKILASSANDKTVRLWHAETGDSLQILNIPKSTLSSLKFLRDGKTLVGVNWQRTVLLWDTNSGKLLKKFTPKLPIFSSGSYKGLELEREAFVDKIGTVTFAIVNKDGTISIQNGQTGKEIITLTSRIKDSDFFTLREEITIESPTPIEDTSNYTTYMDDGTPFPIQYRLGYQSRSNPFMEKQPMKWLAELEFSPNGKFLISRSSYRIIRRRGWSGSSGPTELWDVNTGEQLAVLPWDINIEFSSNGKTLAMMGYGGCAIWDVPARREIAIFPDAKTVRFSGDGKTLVLINKDSYTLWDIATQSEIATPTPILEEFRSFSRRYVLSHNGTTLTTANENGVVNVWHTRTNKPLLTLTSGYTKPLRALAFSHNGKVLASGDATGNTQLWDTNKHNKRITSKTGNNSIRALVFAKDSKTLISESRGKIKVWDVNSGNQDKDFTIPDTLGGGFSASFKDGTQLSRDIVGVFAQHSEKLVIRTINGTEVWDTINGKKLNTFTKIHKSWMTSIFDGKMFAYSQGNDIYLWNMNTGKQVAVIKISKGLMGGLLERFNFRDFSIYSLTFTPDGKTLATGNGNKKIHLWNVATQNLIETISGHQHTVCELTFSADGTILASGDTGGKIRLWDVATGRHLATYEGQKSFVRILTFAPDGKTLASISGNDYRQDGTIFLWNVPSK